MKLTKSQLRKIIKEELLKEIKADNILDYEVGEHILVVQSPSTPDHLSTYKSEEYEQQKLVDDTGVRKILVQVVETPESSAAEDHQSSWEDEMLAKVRARMDAAGIG